MTGEALCLVVTVTLSNGAEWETYRRDPSGRWTDSDGDDVGADDRLFTGYLLDADIPAALQWCATRPAGLPVRPSQ